MLTQELPDGVSCASTIDDPIELAEVNMAASYWSVQANELYVINNMDFSDARLCVSDEDGDSPSWAGVFSAPVRIEGECTYMHMNILRIDSVEVLAADNDIGFFIRKADMAAFLVNCTEI
jgi:hypothetical protein